MKTLVMNVYGLAYDTCAEHVQRSLGVIPGVVDVQIDLMSRTARVRHDEGQCTPDDLVMGIKRVGFQVNGFESLEIDN